VGLGILMAWCIGTHPLYGNLQQARATTPQRHIR